MKKIILASALVMGMATVASAQGQTPVPTPSNPGGSVQQQEMNRNNGPSTMSAPTAKTTGSGAAMSKDPTTTKAGDPQKKSMDDPKQYGSPDKH
jgi:hypothetical protein